MSETWDAIVIGGGPAGLQSALMLGRARRHVLVLDAGQPRNRFAAHMHGVLGQEGRAPGDFLAEARGELAEYEIEIRQARVERVDEVDGGLRVTLEGDGATASPDTGREIREAPLTGRETPPLAGEVSQSRDSRVPKAMATAAAHDLFARSLIVASGLTDRLPDIPGLAQRWGTSVLHCPYCHGWEVRDQRLGVLASSPDSLMHAQLIRQWSENVVVFAGDGLEIAEEQRSRLRSRGIEIVSSPIEEVFGEGSSISGVRTRDGAVVEIDALFAAPLAVANDSFLDHLGLERTETPHGSFLAVDPRGQTSSPRIFAAGNAAGAAANVPMSLGAGAMAGGSVNWLLTAEDFDLADASAGRRPSANEAATIESVWEEKYAEAESIWSGRVNKVLADIATGLEPGRALDLGCGEGGDAIWLAEQGWNVTGVDVSPTAISRAVRHARERGLDEGGYEFIAADLAHWRPEGAYDLVTSSFLHSWEVEIPREEILRGAAGFVAPGGYLLIVSHAQAPSWSDVPHDHHHELPTPRGDLDNLGLGDEWETLACEMREREAIGPNGEQGTLLDGVVLVRRSER
ncbi:bifunctional NAD(P)/FAD-dependent oxidoreductase/class I SAM-dependent methyltransferase [Actinomycetaceae bacterium L2_0104]